MTTTDIVQENLTAKHHRLLRIAKIANIFVWIVFIAFLIYAGDIFLKEYLYHIHYGFSVPGAANSYSDNFAGFVDKLSKEPGYIFSLILNMAIAILRGVVLALVLKGIAVGLNMIVETDVNFRMKSKGESYE